MNTRLNILWAFTFVLALAGFLSVNAQAVLAADIVVVEGETFTIIGDTGVRGHVSEAGATFSMPAINYLRDITVRDVYDPVFRDTVTANIRPGLYPLTIRLQVNGETVSYRSLAVQVIAKSSSTQNQNQQITTSQTNQNTVMVSGPSTVISLITIQPVPDLTPGESIIIPVTVRGYQGTYTLEIPALPFGTYEVPNPITVNGETVIPVLIRVSNDAQPGTYTIPMRFGSEQADAQIRIIKYTERATWWWLIVALGIFLILVAIIIMLVFDSGRRNRRNKEDGERRSGEGKDPLITYY